MASAGTRALAAALLFFSFSAAVVVLFVLLQAPGLADLLASALDRFVGGRGVLELATRRNMILLCHAILLLILRDAGVLGKPASRRSRSSSPGETTAATAVVSQAAAPVPARLHATRSVVAARAAVPVPARPHATRSAVVWRRRPRSRAAAPMHEHDAAAAPARRLIERQPAAESAATWAAPVLTAGPPAQAEEAAAVATKETVVVESPTNDDDSMIVEQLAHPTAIAADGERDCGDRRIVAVADDEEKRTDDQTAGTGMEMEMELADDRAFEEFIKSQRSKMRQESLQLMRKLITSGS